MVDSEIARRHNVSVNLLLAENEITQEEATRLPVGYQIEIPYFTGRTPEDFALNGLSFNNTKNRLEIARSTNSFNISTVNLR